MGGCVSAPTTSELTQQPANVCVEPTEEDSAAVAFSTTPVPSTDRDELVSDARRPELWVSLGAGVTNTALPLSLRSDFLLPLRPLGNGGQLVAGAAVSNTVSFGGVSLNEMSLNPHLGVRTTEPLSVSATVGLGIAVASSASLSDTKNSVPPRVHSFQLQPNVEFGAALRLGAGASVGLSQQTLLRIPFPGSPDSMGNDGPGASALGNKALEIRGLVSFRLPL